MNIARPDSYVAPYQRERPIIDLTWEQRHPGWDKRVALGKIVAEALHELYPGHRWRVYPYKDRSAVGVLHDGIGGRYGMVIHADSLATVGDIRDTVMRSAGEFLERHGIARTRIKDHAEVFYPIRHLIATR